MVSMTSMDIEGLKGILLTIDNWLWAGYVLTPETLKGSKGLDGIKDINGHRGFEGYTIDYWQLILDRLCTDPQNPIKGSKGTHDINDFVMRWTLRDWMVYFQLLTIDFGQICKYMFIFYTIFVNICNAYL